MIQHPTNMKWDSMKIYCNNQSNMQFKTYESVFVESCIYYSHIEGCYRLQMSQEKALRSGKNNCTSVHNYCLLLNLFKVLFFKNNTLMINAIILLLFSKSERILYTEIDFQDYISIV